MFGYIRDCLLGRMNTLYSDRTFGTHPKTNQYATTVITVAGLVALLTSPVVTNALLTSPIVTNALLTTPAVTNALLTSRFLYRSFIVPHVTMCCVRHYLL